MAICCVYCIHDTYYLIVVLSAALVIAPVGYISNTWSSTLRMLSDESDLYMLGNGVACSHTVLELYSPLGDTFLQYALMSVYSAAIAFLFYSLSCGGKRIWAFTVPALLHAMMLIVYLDGFCAEYSLFTWFNLQAWGVADSVSKWRFADSVFCLNISFLLIGMNRHGRGIRTISSISLARRSWERPRTRCSARPTMCPIARPSKTRLRINLLKNLFQRPPIRLQKHCAFPFVRALFLRQKEEQKLSTSLKSVVTMRWLTKPLSEDRMNGLKKALIRLLFSIAIFSIKIRSIRFLGEKKEKPMHQMPSGSGRPRIQEALGRLSKIRLIRLCECAIISMYVQSCLSLKEDGYFERRTETQ